MSNFKLFIGPQTKNVLDAILTYDKFHPNKLGIIVSRDQVENKKFGNSYLYNNKKKFINYIKKNNKKILICRDHGGIYKNNTEKKLSYKKAYSNSLESLNEDAELLFNIIHLDPENFKDRYKDSSHFINSIISANKKIMIEFGEEKKMMNLDKKKYLNDLEFFSKFEKNKKYIVSYTKSYINNGKNYIKFNKKDYEFITKKTKSYGLEIKDHNCDFLSEPNLKKKISLGIKNFNIAPELSYLENMLLLNISRKYKYIKEINMFANLVIKKGKWRRWSNTNSSKDLKFKLAAHYHYKTKEYENLIKKINQHFNFNFFIVKYLVEAINRKLK